MSGAIVFAINNESNKNIHIIDTIDPLHLAGISLHVGFALCVAAAVIGIVAGIILIIGSLISCRSCSGSYKVPDLQDQSCSSDNFTLE